MADEITTATVSQNRKNRSQSEIVVDDGTCKVNDFSNAAWFAGKTPLIPLNRLLKPHSSGCKVWAKCEFRNATGSAHDRFVVDIINTAKGTGQLSPGMRLITGGDGNLCVSLSWAGAMFSIPVTIIPGKFVNNEKLSLCKGYGAHVVLSLHQDTTPPGSDGNSIQLLQNHINQLEKESSIHHFPILPFSHSGSAQAHFDSLAEEIANELGRTSSKLDVIIFPQTHPGMGYSLARKFLWNVEASSSTNTISRLVTIVGVDFSENSFAQAYGKEEQSSESGNGNGEDIKCISVSDGEAYDMARRLLREEGLPVGPVSGAVVAAAVKFIEETQAKDTQGILVVLPDSLSSGDDPPAFLSTDWMISKKYYNPHHLESLYWWYDMALENISPPLMLIIETPNAPAKDILDLMKNENMERAVVISENKQVFGVISLPSLEMSEKPVKDICNTTFGMIDSKASFHELNRLLQRYHWVVNIHRIEYYSEEEGKESPEICEEVIGLINLADFINYTKTIEHHHLSEYGMSMSDGVPSSIWLDRFKEHVKKLGEELNSDTPNQRPHPCPIQSPSLSNSRGGGGVKQIPSPDKK